MIIRYTDIYCFRDWLKFEQIFKNMLKIFYIDFETIKKNIREYIQDAEYDFEEEEEEY